MLRKLKVFGAALITVFWATGMFVSVASAQGKITSDGPVKLFLTQTGEEGSNRLSAFGSTIECSSVTHTGYKLNVTPHGLIPSGSTAATMTPHYSGCTANTSLGVKPATANWTSCDFVYTIGAATLGGWGLTTHVKCSTPGDKVHIEVYNDIAHTELICSLTIGEQSISGAHIFNTANGHLGIVGTFTELTATRSKLCTLNGKGTSTTSATLSSDYTVEGKNAVGEKTNISIS